MDPAMIELAERVAAESRRHFDIVAAKLQQRFDVVAAEIREHSDAVAAETRQRFDVVAAETREHSDAVAAESRRHFDVVAAETREHSDAVAAESRRHFDVVAEGLRGDLRLVAEGVSSVDQRLTSFKAELKGEFEELRAMIRLSYAELDRRLRTLEGGLSVLEARIARLESASH